MSKHRRPADRRPGLALAALSVAAITLLGASSPALAAKGGGGKGGAGAGTSSLRLLMVDPADSVINQHDEVTFEVSTTATTRPFVGVRCSQDGGNLVYDGYVGYFPDYFSDTTWFTLDSPYWTDGVAADCVARLFA
jgi:hypothetical protein